MRRRSVLAVAVGLALAFAGAAQAQRRGRGGGNGGREGGRGMDRDEAAAAVREHTGGRVLGVQTQDGGRGPGYDVKVLLPDGRIRVIGVDPRTGAVGD